MPNNRHKPFAFNSSCALLIGNTIYCKSDLFQLSKTQDLMISMHLGNDLVTMSFFITLFTPEFEESILKYTCFALNHSFGLLSAS